MSKDKEMVTTMLTNTVLTTEDIQETEKEKKEDRPKPILPPKKGK